jgi:hypothetical protein
VLWRWLLAAAAPVVVGLMLSPGTAGADCAVTSSTVGAGLAVPCQTVSVASVSTSDLAVAAAIFGLVCGSLCMRAWLSR